MQKLLAHWWPGNVRELRNALERAVLLCENETITPELFSFLGEEAGAAVSAGPVPVNLPYRDAMDQMTLSCQREYLLALLKKCDGNVTKAAELANIERESFHRLMRKCGIRSEDIKREKETGS
jgi:DNA-binding NtrC family response regulator